MIASLADAWEWYQGTRGLTRAMQRLGEKHWDTLPWEGQLGRDERLRHLQSVEILETARTVLDDLDDLCVLLLFSVFEAIVRTRVLADIEGAVSLLRHPTLKHASEAAQEAIEHGSFYKVLEPYKGTGAGLIEEVNQVRRYRNWVAHGRRGDAPDAVSPRMAYDRLQRFLDHLDATASPG